MANIGASPCFSTNAAAASRTSSRGFERSTGTSERPTDAPRFVKGIRTRRKAPAVLACEQVLREGVGRRRLASVPPRTADAPGRGERIDGLAARHLRHAHADLVDAALVDRRHDLARG